MKLSAPRVSLGMLVATALSVSPPAASRALAKAPIDLNSDQVQVVHSAGDDADTTTLNITFTIWSGDDCDPETDAVATGVEVALLGESCDSFYWDCDNSPYYCPGVSSFPFNYFVNPFHADIVNHQTYGTFNGLNPVGQGPGTVTARIVALAKPAESCGQWNLNLEATGLNLSSITADPISLWLNDANDEGPVCFDIHNAVVGNPIPTPRPTAVPTPVVLPVPRRLLRR